MELFIEKIQHLRGVMLGVSFSALVLAPLAIGISIYLITHPKFLRLIENENEFGSLLMVLLSGIFIVSGIWLITGMRQFKILSSWKKRYSNYLKKKEELDRSISTQFNLDEK